MMKIIILILLIVVSCPSSFVRSLVADSDKLSLKSDPGVITSSIA